MNNMQLSEQMVKHQTTGIQSRLTQICILYTYLFKIDKTNVMTNITNNKTCDNFDTLIIDQNLISQL